MLSLEGDGRTTKCQLSHNTVAPVDRPAEHDLSYEFCRPGKQP